MQALTNIAKKPPSWSKEFDTLVRAIGECKSKAEEDAIIMREIEILKPRLKDPKLDKRSMKELLVRLIYVEMLGHDASWAHVKALQACSDANLLTKKVAYLASTLFLDHRNDTIILVVNTLQSDLKSDNFATVCTALFAVCKLINADLINAVLPTIIELLSHPKEVVRKKAVMALHRFQQLDPNHDGALHGVDLDRHFRQMLCDKDPSVMAAALCALQELVRQDPKPYRNLVPSFVSILKQVAEHRLPKAFEYHKTPAPFIQLKLLQILAVLGSGDKAASEHMYTVVAETMRRGNTGHTIGNALVYECVRTIATIYPNPPLLQSAAEMIASFLKAPSHNLKYVGIESLSRIVRINPKYATEHQMAVIECLEDPDVTLKKKTLELLYKMTKPDNVEVIVEKMLDYLRSTMDEVAKADVCQRISELAESYAPDTSWFIATMNQVFEMGGDVVAPQFAQNLMTLIAQGSGDADADDAGLRLEAVESYLQLLDKPKLPQILLQVIAWVLGEYGHTASVGGVAVMDRVAGMVAQYKVTDDTRGYVLLALAKLAAHSGRPLTQEAKEVLHAALSSRNVDLQQRALEAQALVGLAQSTQRSVLPEDAAMEDVAIDGTLPFLDAFVQQALSSGAAPYIPEEERRSMGIVRQSASDAASQSASASHPLRFEAYETAKPPSHSQTPSMDSAALGHAGNGVFDLIDSPSREQPQQAVAVAAAPSAAPSAGLRVQAGAKKWGPARFDATPVSPPPPGSFVDPSSRPSAAPAAQPVLSARHSAPAPEEDPHKQRLAASLFGGAGGKTSAARVRTGAKRSSPRDVAPTPPGSTNTMDLLLDLDVGTGPSSAPSSATAAASMSDPFAQLEGLSVAPEPAVQPAAQNKPAAPGMIDLDALMGVSAAAPTSAPGGMPGMVGFPPAVGSMATPMGGAGMPAYGMMGQPTMGGMVQPMGGMMQPMGGMVQPMGGMVQPMAATSMMPPVVSATAPPQVKAPAKPDPFADLFK